MWIRLGGRPTLHVGSLALLVACPASADLSSASYTIRGGNVSAAASDLSSSSYTGFGALGQSEAIGFSGGAADLTTIAPGFFPIVAGDFADLDLDGDGVAYFLDADADGDGLADVVETNTSIFVSAFDTGTDSLISDSDGDGFLDGVEVAAGSDPTSPLSVPGSLPLPVLNPLSRGLVALALTLAAVWARRLGRRKRS